MSFFTFLIGLIAVSPCGFAFEPDWSKGALIPEHGRPNPYQLSDLELNADVRAGRLHALHYPVSVTGLLLPTKPIDRLFRKTPIAPWRSLDDLQKWLNLPEYPNAEGSGVYNVPFANGVKPQHRMGFSPWTTDRGHGFTVSCAQCHSENLFGRPVIGLSNRFPKANRLFVHALNILPNLSPQMFQSLSGASDGETEMYVNSRNSLNYVEAREPIQLGLDTSLAQVALSLAKQTHEAPDISVNQLSDSKPAVWWNVKYKNRWLSDGSVVSGNPILTNFLWNEIGRGTELNLLSGWLKQNARIIRELTTAVFASQAPRYTDFFAPPDVVEAKKGEGIFLQRCAHCHGTYEKDWSSPSFPTIKVKYPQPTPVVNVGTDPGRYRGMRALEKLNGLVVSQENGILIQRQYGYVPPPLEGIWVRWPYFHNNSAPSLCAVLTKSSARPKRYLARPANDKNKDFDKDCNGYPTGGTNWPSEFLYEAGDDGKKNTGHDEGIFLENGRELLTPSEKISLIRFLQTL